MIEQPHTSRTTHLGGGIAVRGTPSSKIYGSSRSKPFATSSDASDQGLRVYDAESIRTGNLGSRIQLFEVNEV